MEISLLQPQCGNVIIFLSLMLCNFSWLKKVLSNQKSDHDQKILATLICQISTLCSISLHFFSNLLTYSSIIRSRLLRESIFHQHDVPSINVKLAP